MVWAVILAKKAARQLDKVSGADWTRVRRAIDELAADPLGGDVAPLHGPQWKGYFRKRVGDFRIILTIDHAEHVVTVHALLRRSEKTYR